MTEERTYDVLVEDGRVIRYATADFDQIVRTTSRPEMESLLADGWLPLDEEVELEEPQAGPSAVRQAFRGEATPPPGPKQVITYVVGQLKPGATGVQEV